MLLRDPVPQMLYQLNHRDSSGWTVQTTFLSSIPLVSRLSSSYLDSFHNLFKGFLFQIYDEEISFGFMEVNRKIWFTPSSLDKGHTGKWALWKLCWTFYVLLSNFLWQGLQEVHWLLFNLVSSEFLDIFNLSYYPSFIRRGCSYNNAKSLGTPLTFKGNH